MRYCPSRCTLAWAVGLALGSLPGTLLAAGFYLQEQSVSGLGRAFAGEAAIASDASTVYFNPAGMTRLDGPEFQAAAHVLLPRARIRDGGSTASTPFGGANQPIGGSSGGNPYEASPIPNLFYARPLNERTWIGFGLTAPFGLSNEYDDDFFARYDSTETSLRVIDLQPSIAWQLNERVSIGGGLNIQYADATLKNAVLDPAGASTATDGEFALSGDSWDYGFNIGMLADIGAHTRLGVHYRQGITHTLEGTARTVYPQNVGLPTLRESGEAKLKLPDIVSVGLSHRFSDRWTGLAQYTWFKWSNFDEIAVSLDTSSDVAVAQNYRDTWALSLGAEYALDERWTLRGGIQYDHTPTRDGYRSTRTPDGDRTWISLGASHERDGRLGFDLAYTYIHVSKESLELTRDFPTGTVNLTGSTEGRVHILAAALRYRF